MGTWSCVLYIPPCAVLETNVRRGLRVLVWILAIQSIISTGALIPALTAPGDLLAERFGDPHQCH